MACSDKTPSVKGRRAPSISSPVDHKEIYEELLNSPADHDELMIDYRGQLEAKEGRMYRHHVYFTTVYDSNTEVGRIGLKKSLEDRKENLDDLNLKSEQVRLQLTDEYPDTTITEEMVAIEVHHMLCNRAVLSIEYALRMEGFDINDVSTLDFNFNKKPTLHMVRDSAKHRDHCEVCQKTYSDPDIENGVCVLYCCEYVETTKGRDRFCPVSMHPVCFLQGRKIRMPLEHFLCPYHQRKSEQEGTSAPPSPEYIATIEDAETPLAGMSQTNMEPNHKFLWSPVTPFDDTLSHLSDVAMEDPAAAGHIFAEVLASAQHLDAGRFKRLMENPAIQDSMHLLAHVLKATAPTDNSEPTRSPTPLPATHRTPALAAMMDVTPASTAPSGSATTKPTGIFAFGEGHLDMEEVRLAVTNKRGVWGSIPDLKTNCLVKLFTKCPIDDQGNKGGGHFTVRHVTKQIRSNLATLKLSYKECTEITMEFLAHCKGRGWITAEFAKNKYVFNKAFSGNNATNFALAVLQDTNSTPMATFAEGSMRAQAEQMAKTPVVKTTKAESIANNLNTKKRKAPRELEAGGSEPHAVTQPPGQEPME